MTGWRATVGARSRSGEFDAQRLSNLYRDIFADLRLFLHQVEAARPSH
jgi:hypothetical protein